jgi:hypothetical protein
MPTRSESLPQFTDLFLSADVLIRFQKSLGIGLATGIFATGIRQQYRPLTAFELQALQGNVNNTGLFFTVSGGNEVGPFEIIEYDMVTARLPKTAPPSKSPLTTLSYLFSETPQTEFTSEKERGCTGQRDTAWDPRKDSTRETGASGWNLGFPTPSGGYCYMRDLSNPKSSSFWFNTSPQKELTEQQRRRNERRILRGRPSDPDTVMDLAHLTFKPGIVEKLIQSRTSSEPQEHLIDENSEGTHQEKHNIAEQDPGFLLELQAWGSMRTQLLGLNGCSEIGYSICAEPANTIYVWLSK